MTESPSSGADSSKGDPDDRAPDGVAAGMTAKNPPGDVDRDADPLPEPHGHGPLSEGKDGQQFG